MMLGIVLFVVVETITITTALVAPTLSLLLFPVWVLAGMPCGTLIMAGWLDRKRY